MRTADEVLTKLCFFSKMKKIKKKHKEKYLELSKKIFDITEKKYIEEKIENTEIDLVICNTAMQELFWVMGNKKF